jgi:serine/threonine-protein kinase
VRIVSDACHGLNYAHRAGVVHRDVKPGNLLVANETGTTKLADFGIAKAAEQTRVTQVGSVLGTAAYLAPEQAAGEQAGPAADLYALGVVAYQLMSGRLPYEAQSLTELALKQQREVPPRLDELNPDVPPQLAMAVDRALALDPRQRPASADELRSMLADGARGIGPETDPTTNRAAGPATGATSVVGQHRTGSTGVARAPVQQRQPRAPRAPRPAPATYATQAPVAHPQRRRGGAKRFLGTLLVLLLLAAGGAAAVVATSNSDQAIRLRRVVYDDVNQGVDALKQLVNDNTK